MSKPVDTSEKKEELYSLIPAGPGPFPGIKVRDFIGSLAGKIGTQDEVDRFIAEGRED